MVQIVSFLGKLLALARKEKPLPIAEAIILILLKKTEKASTNVAVPHPPLDLEQQSFVDHTPCPLKSNSP
jgi:hypothetical protein